ncbi:MAG TPA: hypothetical protein DCQ31_00160 [Bacteroidales bacterium]|nr:hypothetical protein [Bacteroidales bacterium]
MKWLVILFLLYKKHNLMNRSQLQIKIKQICSELIYKQGYISSIDVLEKLGYITDKNIKAWRFGEIPYLERICSANLATLSFINKIIRQIVNNLNLKSSLTIYMKHGKGVKSKLIFSKTGDDNIEKAYSTHYIDNDRINELKQTKTIEMKGL